MASQAKETTPEVTWAQRSSADVVEKNIVYLTISAPDVPKDAIKIDLQPDSLTFSGHSETKKTTYHVKLDFYAPVDVEKSVTHHTARDVEFVLRKKDKQAEYWPHLTKEKKKLHFLKTNFDKWVDEDEQDGVADENPMAGMGGMEGMGGMGGMGGDGGLGGIDFSKLGGAGGFPGAGGPGGLGGDDSDDDMPDLEDEGEGEKAEAANESDVKGKGKAAPVEEAGESSTPKITEVN